MRLFDDNLNLSVRLAHKENFKVFDVIFWRREKKQLMWKKLNGWYQEEKKFERNHGWKRC